MTMGSVLVSIIGMTGLLRFDRVFASYIIIRLGEMKVALDRSGSGIGYDVGIDG
jgi:hypothetical protein